MILDATRTKESSDDELADEERENATVDAPPETMAEDPEVAGHVVAAALNDRPELRPAIRKALNESWLILFRQKNSSM